MHRRPRPPPPLRERVPRGPAPPRTGVQSASVGRREEPVSRVCCPRAPVGLPQSPAGVSAQGVCARGEGVEVGARHSAGRSYLRVLARDPRGQQAAHGGSPGSAARSTERPGGGSCFSQLGIPRRRLRGRELRACALPRGARPRPVAGSPGQDCRGRAESKAAAGPAARSRARVGSGAATSDRVRSRPPGPAPGSAAERPSLPRACLPPRAPGSLSAPLRRRERTPEGGR